MLVNVHSCSLLFNVFIYTEINANGMFCFMYPCNVCVCNCIETTLIKRTYRKEFPNII